MDFGIIGLSHHSAGIELRERLNLSTARIDAAYDWLMARGIDAMVLSTCNRVEVWAYGLGEHLVPTIEAMLADVTDVDAELFRPHLRRFTGSEAVRHAMRVAGGLDSMVLGEPQILGQFKDAFAQASDRGAVGPLLTRLGQRTLQVAKRVRTETRIGEFAVNLSTVAVRLAEEIFDPVAEKQVLVLGAGEMAELALAHFKSRQVRHLVICNRTEERARELAVLYGIEYRAWETWPEQIGQADIVVVGAGAEFTIFRYDQVKDALHEHAPRPRLIIDLAVPRAVEPRVGRLADTFLYCVDDLQRLSDENLQRRTSEAAAAEQIIDGAVAHFAQWYERQRLAPALSDFSVWLEQIRADEVARSLKRADELDAAQLADHVSSAVVRRILKVMAQRANQAEDRNLWAEVLGQVTENLAEEHEDENQSRIS